jgi:Zn ribbon nucleic-acid-binding protein
MSRIVAELKCPKCGCDEFLAGPRGGAARNIKCARCGYWMNVTPVPRTIPGTDMLVEGRFWIETEEDLRKGG